ncbi:MAG TPA: DUF1499 domain-containing protein [Rhodopila sp.]|jgi:hypothetical protein|nr:DUF1499 domain-containing protein [Rhodopila sp.]
MNLPAWFASVMMPACDYAGAQGLQMPPPAHPAAAASQPRVCEAVNYLHPNQSRCAARNAVFSFSGPTMVRAVPDQSDLILRSGSVYAESDFGVNHERLMTWIAARQAQLSHTREK